jgi:hypothetical protein
MASRRQQNMKNAPQLGEPVVRISFFPITVIAVSAVALIILEMRMHYVGFDFTDEGYYLNWFVNPWQYSASTTQFGFIYHPIFKIAGDNVVTLRHTSRLVDLILGFAVFYVLIKRTFNSNQWSWELIAFALALASTVRGSSQEWLQTPGYNSLNLQGLLIVVIGLMIAPEKTPRQAFTGAFLVGVGGWLCFMARPTTAAALALLVAAYLLIATPRRLLCVGVAVSTALPMLAATAVLIDGSFGDFVARLLKGWELRATFDE